MIFRSDCVFVTNDDIDVMSLGVVAEAVRAASLAHTCPHNARRYPSSQSQSFEVVPSDAMAAILK